MKNSAKHRQLKLFVLLSIIVINGVLSQINNPTFLNQLSPLNLNYTVSGSLEKKVTINVSTTFNYANLSILADGKVILDNIDIISSGTHSLNAIVRFPQSGQITLTIATRSGNVTINQLNFQDISIQYPLFTDVTQSAGITTGPALKYAGPTIADMDNDGDYDMIFNNHNDPNNPSKLVWNDGNGVFDRSFNLARWRLQDLHGSSAADFDNDGDLDLVATRGGGNGTSPNTPDFYINNNGTLTLGNDQVGITEGARGRSAVWGDFDSDNDLDLVLLNAQWNNPNGGKHVIYRNNGNGRFETIRVPNFENAAGDRFLLTDIDGDHIDDFIVFFPISVWKGNGDFTFTNVTSQWIPAGVQGLPSMLAMADFDMDNDGDLDIYISRGKTYTQVADKAIDYNPVTQIMHVKDRGDEGRSLIDFTAVGDFTLKGFEAVFRSTYNGDYPIFLGSAKTPVDLTQITGERIIKQNQAQGWPSARNQNGIYIGHTGNGNWKLESVRTGVLYWSISWTLEGISSATPGFTPNNKNVYDILLKNEGNKFVNVANDWNVPLGGNSWGVTTGDFNNDGFADIFVNRYPLLNERVSDYMLLNTGNGKFEVTTSHGADDAGESSHGDQSQAFDYDLDGDVDILDGSDERGTWHLYSNQRTDANNYVIVNVGYSPNSNIDPISAEITVKTNTKTLFKRVGSSGSAHSQSLLNMVHFGLGNDAQIQEVTVRWRNGETKTFTNESVNQVLSTDGNITEEEKATCDLIPSMIPAKQSIVVPVRYTANQTRDIVVLAYVNNTWAGTGKVTVNKGSGVANVVMNFSSTPVAGTTYEFRTSIRSVDAPWQQSITLCTNENIAVANGTELVDCSVLPVKINSNTSITVPIYYAANTNRDVIVALWNTNWLGVGKTTVSAGSGIANVTITVPNAPVSGTTYSLRGAIRPEGTGWQQNISICIQDNVTVPNGSKSKIDTTKYEQPFSISPNPSYEEIQLLGVKSGKHKVLIFDFAGKLVKDTLIKSENHTIDIRDLSRGTYFVKIDDSLEGVQFVKK
ncbi:FG-GAP-like repeat-containing protein [uncultured Aquimarina sp.]|uniref:FG-GAP-like repeat-containing protein n=1 Tax=uncultured Aquimarina sp. TaxID=575652 RepID=UPI002631D17A|nr:FG-GAP-like repeat-containing protein [uncultured Aquimarina sp.]